MKTPCQRMEAGIKKFPQGDLASTLSGGCRSFAWWRKETGWPCAFRGKDSMLLAKVPGDPPPRKCGFSAGISGDGPGYHPDNRRMIEENARLMEIPIHVVGVGYFSSFTVADIRENPAISAPGCGAAFSTPTRRLWAAIRSPWAIISTM